jgi:hypothetical protein
MPHPSTLQVRAPRFAPVAPIQILSDLFACGEFGDYHLYLAHHTVEHAARFGALSNRVLSHRDYLYKDVTIIMDNSIVELGGAVDDDMIRAACHAVNPTASSRIHVIPVLPDVMGNGVDTIDLSTAAYDRWSSLDHTMPMGGNWVPGEGYMVVTQGDSWSDFVSLVNHFFIENLSSFPHIRWVGIPRKLQAVGINREQAIRYVQMVAPHVKIHLLGFSSDMGIDLLNARSGGVTGIDSAVPVRYPKLLTPDTYVGPRDPEWMEKGVLTQQNRENISNVRKWVSGF